MKKITFPIIIASLFILAACTEKIESKRSSIVFYDNIFSKKNTLETAD